jgi:hypothetical protein
MPDQELPLQLLPDHEFPDQLLPDHELPDQLLPLQVLPLQVLPLQVLPDHVLPFHVPPNHEVPAASASASTFGSIALPKMSCSPVSTAPFSVRWSEPRASSIVPPPFAAPNVCVYAAGFLPASETRSSSPAPWASESAPGTLRALFVMNRFTASGVSVGYFYRISAIAPDVIAAASLVPLPRK